MRYFSMFSGIGGFELGIQRACDKSADEERQQAEPDQDMRQVPIGEVVPEVSRSSSRIRNVSETERSLLPTNIRRFRPVCIGYSEIDKYAIKVYERNFNGHKNYGDATAINPTELPDFDLLVGGFPCQAFSIAGKRAGFNDTRGTLFFDIARILAEKRPRHLVLENVKGLLSHDSGKTLQTIFGVLSDLGYRVEWQILNSKNFGVPQNRERIYIVGHLRGECGGKVFPITGATGKAIKQLNPGVRETKRVYSDDGVSPTLNTAQGGQRVPKVQPAQWRRTELGKKIRSENQKKGKDYTPFTVGARELVPKDSDISGTITSQAIAKDSLMFEGTRIRRLTPKECERLQGFPDNWTAGESDTQRYKMCGNAVTVNVVEAVITNLIKHLDD